MPNVTLYLPKDLHEWLQQQPDKSKIVQEMIRRRMQRERREEQKAS